MEDIGDALMVAHGEKIDKAVVMSGLVAYIMRAVPRQKTNMMLIKATQLMSAFDPDLLKDMPTDVAEHYENVKSEASQFSVMRILVGTLMDLGKITEQELMDLVEANMDPDSWEEGKKRLAHYLKHAKEGQKL